jgi:hypothetical protein
MKIRLKATPPRWRGLVAVLVCALSTPTLRAQTVTASATADRTTIRLSENLRATFTIEGPAPLRVELPKDLLSAESAASWRIRPAGPAKTEPLPDGRERWSQTYRLDPYLPGDDVRLTFAPAKVTAGTALRPAEPRWPEIDVKVQTALIGSRADAARPVTPVEELPPLPPDQPELVGWYVAGTTTLLFTAAVLLALRRRWREKRRALPPGEWAAAELDRLERDRAAGGRLAERLAAVLREYVERRDGLPAPKLTTTELLAEAERVGWPAESVAALRGLLERCDRAKFAGEAPTDAEGGELLGRAREWVKSQVRGQRSEVRGQESEVSGQKAEGSG